MSEPTHFQRYRLERPLAGVPEPMALPLSYYPVPWREPLLQLHADVKYQSFRDDRDGRFFPNLADRAGCRELMAAIRARDGFCPGATWLIAGPDGYCGTVQGVLEPGGTGAIQNLGIIPEHRGRGLGRALVILALRGFERAGARRCVLEVTAGNRRAVELYLSCGFRRTRVFYRALPTVLQPSGL